MAAPRAERLKGLTPLPHASDRSHADLGERYELYVHAHYILLTVLGSESLGCTNTLLNRLSKWHTCSVFEHIAFYFLQHKLSC